VHAACSIKKLAINKLGDTLAQGGSTYASDDDPQLVREALPFALKLIESLLEESPRHRGLLLAAAGGFTQYTYAFVQQDADEAEDHDLQAAAALHDRARRLYLRARDYGLRGLDAAHEGPPGICARAGGGARRRLEGGRPAPVLDGGVVGRRDRHEEGRPRSRGRPADRRGSPEAGP